LILSSFAFVRVLANMLIILVQQLDLVQIGHILVRAGTLGVVHHVFENDLLICELITIRHVFLLLVVEGFELLMNLLWVHLLNVQLGTDT
jgi:hypothetical protein